MRFMRCRYKFEGAACASAIAFKVFGGGVLGEQGNGNFHYQKVDASDPIVKAEIAAHLLDEDRMLPADGVQWACPAARDFYGG
jgi:hypothetical protein